MKTKLTAILIALVSLSLRFFAGRYHTAKSWNTFFMDHAYADASNQAHFYIRALTFLREGQESNAIEFLESRLDGSLLTFLTYEDVLPENRNEAGLRAIKAARQYRAEHPHKSTTPEIEDGVHRVFSLKE